MDNAFDSVNEPSSVIFCYVMWSDQVTFEFYYFVNKFPRRSCQNIRELWLEISF